MEFFFFSNFLQGIGLFTINNFVFSYYRQSVNAIEELIISLNDIDRYFRVLAIFYLQYFSYIYLYVFRITDYKLI